MRSVFQYNKIILLVVIIANLVFWSRNSQFSQNPNNLWHFGTKTPPKQKRFYKYSLKHPKLNDHKPQSIDLALVINLDHRIDRWESISKLLYNMSVPFERIPAVNPRNDTELTKGCFDNRLCPGQVGCKLSHIRAIERAMELELNTVAIFEDDFVLQPFFDPTYFNELIYNTTSLVPNWDVIVLSLNIQSETVMHSYDVKFASSFPAKLSRVHIALATQGYILKKSMFNTVLHTFVECDVKRNEATAIDECWKPLQSNYTWIGFEPQFATQSNSFSDIQMTFVEYKIHR